ncbi:MAG: HepT-like ribonuclease domain-containing protein [Moorellaceae bacterium]
MGHPPSLLVRFLPIFLLPERGGPFLLLIPPLFTYFYILYRTLLGSFARGEAGENSDLDFLLIHEYFGVDLALVWVTVQKDLPILREAILEILKAEGAG